MMSFLGSHAYEMSRQARSLVNSSCCHERPRLSFKNDQAGVNTRGPRVARLDASSVGQSGGTFPGCCKELRAWPNRSACQYPNRNSGSLRPCWRRFSRPGRHPQRGVRRTAQTIGRSLLLAQCEIAGASPARPFLEPNWRTPGQDDRRSDIPFGTTGILRSRCGRLFQSGL